MICRTRFARLTLACLLLWPSTMLGQSIAGLVVDDETDMPLPGTFVVLLDAEGLEVTRTLTTRNGNFRLSALTDGTYSLRVERIGIADVVSGALQLASGRVANQTIRVARAPVRLADMQVQATQQCTMLAEDATELIRVWEEARKALKATVWTGQQAYYRFDGLHSRRLLDVDGNETGEVVLDPIRTYGARPFSSAEPDDLAFGGWVQRSIGGRVVFYGPDARVLLSQSFISRHCYRLGREGVEDSSLLGVHFEPLPNRRLNDISGVLWIDAETAELVSLDFRYERLDLPFESPLIGGEVEFDQLPDGAWIVRRFVIRKPVVSAGRSRSFSGRAQMRLVGFEEEGQAVTAIWRTADLQAGPTDALPEGVAAANAPADELVIRYTEGPDRTR